MYRFLSQEGRFLGLEDNAALGETSRVIIVPVPFERTSSYGGGAGNGPAAILSASKQVELYDGDLGFEPWKAALGIATLFPLRVNENDDGKSIAERVDRVVDYWLTQGKTVVTLAGEHTGVVGAIRAYARHYEPLTILQLDAHSDARDTYLDDPWNHACTMARVFDFHSNVVQVGIRSEAIEEPSVLQRMGIPVFRSADIQRDHRLGADWIAPIIEACAENVYVTLDSDVMDPSVIPATGTPEPGGVTWEQMEALWTRLAEERNVVGVDMSELAPIPGISFPEFTAAKLLYRIIGHVFKGS